MGLGPTDDHGRHNNRAPGMVASARVEWDEFSGRTQLNTLTDTVAIPSVLCSAITSYSTVFEYSTC